MRGHLFWGGGTVSPTALSETNSTGTLAFDQYGYPYDSTKGNEYETNHHTTAVVSSDGSWAYQKFTNSQGDVYILVLTENFDQALTGQTINCQVISKAPTLTGGTYNGIVQLGSTDQRSDASGCTFNAPIAVLAAGTTLTGCTANSSVQCAAADITLTGCTINRKSDDSTVLWLSKYDDSNTAAGCSMTLNNCNVSCGVLVSTDGKATINGGVFAKEPQGATGSLYKLSAEGASFNGMASPVYVANQTAVPQIEITYSANPAHKVIAWRFDIDNSIKQHGNSDATDPRAAVLLAQANYTHSADNRTIRFDCVPSIKYNGYTMGALNADTVFSPVLDVLPSELTFHAATENGPASVELGADMPADRIDISCFYTNVATNEVSEEYPTEAGTYQISVILKAKGLSDELKYNIYQNRVEWNGAYHQLSYANESTGNTLTSLTSENWRFQISTNTVTLTVDENGAPVIPENAKGVRYENNTLTIDEHTTARFAQGSTVKCDIVNNGTLDGGLFTGTVTGSGSIARGLFLHDPKTSLPTMMLSVPENASLNGITAPDATGLTTLYAINTLDGEDNTLLFIGDYIGTDPHDFYGWDLVYSLDGEEKNSDVEKNYIGKTHFEQPMYGPIPDGQNGVKCIFLPVLEMNASDLTITADKTESKIDGAVIASVKYVDASDPNAAPSSVYPTKAGSYKAIVTLTCPGDSTYSKARVARIGNLCYYVPETLEVEVTVELPTVPPTDGDGNVTFEGTDEVKGDGWTAKKDDEGKTTVEITDGKNLGNTTLNCNKITIGSAETSTTVSNITTNADVTVASGSAIEGGTFSGNVSGTGTIEGGTFSGNVGSEVKINGGTFTGNVDSTKINGGVFAGEIPTTVESTKVTATGGASINNIQKNEGTNQETAVQVVGEQQLSLAYTPDEGRTFYGWQKDADIIAKGDATPTVSADSTDSVYTPVVEMNLSDIQDGESNIEGTAVTSIRYYKVDANGLPEGDGYDDAPVDDGTFEDGRYVQYIALKLTDEPTENTIALYADEDVPSRVVVKNGIGYYVPEFLATGEEVRIGDIPDDTATGSGDSGAGGAAVAVIGGAAIGGAAYLIGTQVYLTSVLPEGASIPTNRQQLADLLWTAAGKPQPASTALFTDISAEAADSQKAARWCVEQGLLKDTGSTFKPDKHTFRPQVIKAWNDLQAKLNPQK